MGELSKIEWTDHTFNPCEGCQKVGPGCDHCYAETRNARYNSGQAVNWGPGTPRRRTSAANWRKPLAWNHAHEQFFAQYGWRQRVFRASLADVFDNATPDAWRADLIDLIWKTPRLHWLLFTKRIGHAERMIARALELAGRGINTPWPWSNVWIGAAVVNQEADRDIPKLLAVPAVKRFLSMEPLLGRVDLACIDLNYHAGLSAQGHDRMRNRRWRSAAGHPAAGLGHRRRRERPPPRTADASRLGPRPARSVLGRRRAVPVEAMGRTGPGLGRFRRWGLQGCGDRVRCTSGRRRFQCGRLPFRRHQRRRMGHAASSR